MSFSEILNILLGTGLMGLVVAVATMKATVRKANADAEKAKADAETVRITNTENATRILVENIVKPLKEELNATRTDLQATKRRWPLPREKWPGCARLSRLLPAAVMLTIALCFSSCATTKRHRRSRSRPSRLPRRSDTTAAVTRLIATQPVPESRVSLAVSVDSLLKLPEGAAYRESNDRAHVEATHQGGVIYITGTCDSCSVRWNITRRSTTRHAMPSIRPNSRSCRSCRKKTPTTPWWADLAMLMLGYIVGAAATIFVTKDKIFKK